MSGIIPGASRGSTVESAVRTTALTVPDGPDPIVDTQLSVMTVAPFSLYAVSLFLIVPCNGTQLADILHFTIRADPFASVGIPSDAYNAFQAIQFDATTSSTAQIYQEYSELGNLSYQSMITYGGYNSGGFTNILRVESMYYTGSLPGSQVITVSFHATSGDDPTDATECTVLPGSFLTLTRLT